MEQKKFTLADLWNLGAKPAPRPGTVGGMLSGILTQESHAGILADRSPQGILGQVPERRHTFGGVPMRQPYQSEVDFFKRSGVPAYSSPDGSVVFNPGAKLDPAQRRSLEMNEAARVWMSRNQLKPNFDLSPAQRAALQGTHYANASPEDQRATIAARLLAGDPSAGQPTPEQEAFVKRLRQAMGIR